MNRERWERLKPLFHGALEQPPHEREQWLRDASPDAALRADVLALLRSHDTAGAFLEVPAAVDPSDLHDDLDRQIGPYVIRRELGRGGMGVVYLAEDLRLGRTVALKALPPALSNDAQRRERLRREARAAAALNHPGIAVVYALEEFDGELYIATEYVRGRTLRAELSEGALGVARAHSTAIEIARAVCAAHDAGIVHRDLKPENVLRTDDDRVKILDFGIAQFTDHTLTQLTAAGAVMGTPAYMAPEQLLGQEVDFRADQYAVGVLIVEMATGRHPFATGEAAGAQMPDTLRAIADRCLARDPRERYATTRELLAALEASYRDSVKAGPDDSSERAGPRPAPAATFTPVWWWEFHQAAAAVVYGVLAIPLWNARVVIGGAVGRTVFLVALAAIIVSASVRLHLWFTSRFYPGELAWVRGRTGRWVAIADWVFALALVAAGLLVGDDQAALATLLISFGIGIAVVFLVVEPVTERAAFRAR